MDMQNVSNLVIPEGGVKTIHDKDGNLLWGRLAYDTKYAGDTTQDGTPTPDTPIPVQTVTGEQTVEVTGKNLWNPSTVTMNKRLGSDGSYVNDNAYMTSDYIKVEPSTTYTYSRYASGGGSAALCTWQADGTFIERTTWSGSVNTDKTYFTFTTGTNVGFIKICDLKTLTNLQVEQGSTSTAYEPYQSKSYTINLGSIELCKIGTYQDYIYKSGDDWYVHKEVKKVVFDGSADENWLTGDSGGIRFFRIDMSDGAKNTEQAIKIMSDRFIARYENVSNAICISSGVQGRILIFINGITNLVDVWKTWLSEHNVTAYYALATPTDTKITDATLLGQLNAVHEWLTRYGYNSTVTGDLPLIVDRTNL